MRSVGDVPAHMGPNHSEKSGAIFIAERAWRGAKKALKNHHFCGIFEVGRLPT